MRFRNIGIGLATGAASLAIGCSAAPAPNQETPPPIDTSAQTLPYIPCVGYIGGISLVNPDLLQFKVDSIEGSSGCSEIPVTAGIIAVGTFQSTHERAAGDLWIGDTFNAECTTNQPPALLINHESGDGVVMINNHSIEDALAEAGVNPCNEQQLNEVYGR